MDWEELWKDITENTKNWVLDHGPKLLAAILICVIGRKVAKTLRNVLKKLMVKARADETPSGFLRNTVHALLLIVVIFPDAQLTDGNILNDSANDTRRVDMVFGIGYDDDIKKARSLLEMIVADHALGLPQPEGLVAVSELSESSVNLIVRPRVRAADSWTVSCDGHEAVALACDEAGISSPYPQQAVPMHQVS